MSLDKGEEKTLAMKDHTIHFDLPEEQGRIVDRTYYIINEGEPVSVLGKKMLRDEALAYVKEHMTGIMKGKTMMVGFFSRGPAGAKMALPALEITSSTYVMHSGDILYRHCYDGFDEQVEKAGYIPDQRAQRGPEPPRGPAQRPRLHGPQLADHLQHVLHLRRQHPAAEEGQPPLRRGPGHLLRQGRGTLRAHVHHRHGRGQRPDHLVRRRRPQRLRQDHHGHGRHRVRR